MTHNCQISIGICGGVASMRQTKARASVIFFRLRAKYLIRSFNHRLNLSQNFFLVTAQICVFYV